MNVVRHVYLCDDERALRASLSFLLRQHACVVSAFESGPALLEAIDRASKPLRCVFVLDVRMEPMSGPQLHQALIARGLAQRNPVIFLSAHGDIPIAVSAMERGALTFVQKPYTDHALVERLEQAFLLERSLYAREQRLSDLTSMVGRLTPQQRRVAPLIVTGKPNKCIADELAMSESAIEKHRANLFKSLGVGTAPELATLLAEMRALGLTLEAF